MSNNGGASELGGTVVTVIASFVVPSAMCIFYGGMYDLHFKSAIGLGSDLVDLLSRDTVFNGGAILFAALYPVLWGMVGALVLALAAHAIARCDLRHPLAAWLPHPAWPAIAGLVCFAVAFRSRVLLALLGGADLGGAVFALIGAAMVLTMLAATLRATGDRLRIAAILAAALYLVAWTVVAEAMGAGEARARTSYLVATLADSFPAPRTRAIVAKYGDLLIVADIESAADGAAAKPTIVRRYGFLKPDDKRILSLTAAEFPPLAEAATR